MLFIKASSLNFFVPSGEAKPSKYKLSFDTKLLCSYQHIILVILCSKFYANQGYANKGVYVVLSNYLT